MKLMAEAAPEIITQKPIRDLVLLDITNAMNRVVTGHVGVKALGRSTLDGCGSLIRDILGHAEVRGLPVNNLNRYENIILKKMLNSLCPSVDSGIGSSLRLSDHNTPEELLEQELAEKKNIRKSLTMTEMQFIMRHIEEHLLEDGRYIALAIMMYSGLRPGEVRALKWEDIHSIVEINGCRYFEIHHVLDTQNRERPHPKTSNGFRNIPIHCELSNLLSIWKKHISRSIHLPFTQSAPGLPFIQEQPKGYICCKENAFGRPCTYQELADFAKNKVFRHLNTEMRDAIGLELALIKGTRSPEYDPQDDLTLYVLRRNFRTWIQYGTQCTRLEKLYIMGHKMEGNGNDVRSSYSTPQALKTIAAKLDGFTILEEYHPQAVLLTTDNATQYIQEGGFLRIAIPYAYIGEDWTVDIELNCVEKNDTLCLELCSPLAGGQTVNASYRAKSMTPTLENRQTLITESSNLAVIERIKKMSAPKSDS